MKSLPKSKTIVSLLLIGLAAIIVGGATMAWFTGEATVADAEFTAGTVTVEANGPEVNLPPEKFKDNINPGDCGRVTWNIINTGTKDAELRVNVSHLWNFNLDEELADPFAYYPLGEDWVMYEYEGELWLYYTGGPVPGTYSGADETQRTVPLTLVFGFDGPGMGEDFEGKELTLSGNVEAIQASNDAPKKVWGEDFWNAVNADPFEPTGLAATYYDAVSQTDCWKGTTPEEPEEPAKEYDLTLKVKHPQLKVGKHWKDWGYWGDDYRNYVDSTVSGEGTFEEGESVTVSATPGTYQQWEKGGKGGGKWVNKTLKFDGWYDGDTKVSGDNPYTFEMPDHNYTLTATFSK